MNEAVVPQKDQRIRAAALAFALTFPTLMAALYFLVLVPGEGQVSRAQQACYTGGKVIQFTFPVLFLWYWTGAWPRPGRPSFAGWPLGVAFGLATALAMIALYRFVLLDTPLLAETPAKVTGKLQEFGMQGPALFLVMAILVSLVHSLMEEYYWRWFVFAQLREQMALAPAVAISSLGFMAHHVIILYVYLPGHVATAVVPFSLGIAVGGAVWAWLYDRYQTIYPSWLSHALIDGAIFVIGYDLIGRTGS